MMRNTSTKPALRFPEFKEEWKFKFGNEIFEPVSNKNHNSDLPILAISQEFGAVPRDLINYQIAVTEKSVSSYKVVEKGNFIISLRSFQGGIEYSEYKGICSPAYIILRSKFKIEDYFFKYYLRTFRYIQFLQSKLEGIRDGKMISYKYFSEIKLPCPSIEEQKKIADFLIQIDSRIAQLKEKKENLEKYKNGVIQKFFKKELCFKDDEGKPFPDWKTYPIKKILKRYSNPVAVEPNKLYQQIGIRSHGKGIFYKESVTGKSLGNKRVFWIKENKLILNIVFAWERAISKTTINEIGMIASHRFPMYEPVEDLLNLDFILYFFLTLKGKSYLELASPGGAGRNKTLGQVEFEKLKISIPSLKEQNKISSFLQEIDEDIRIADEKIEQTELFRKGLLQKMFCV